MDSVAQVEMFKNGCGVGGVMIHIVPFGHLAGAAVTPAVMGDDAETFQDEIHHLGVPVVRAERPAVVEDDGLGVLGTPVLVEDFNAVRGGDVGHGVVSV